MIRLRTAIWLFLILAILAAVLLSGRLRTFVWILLAGLAIKTAVASKKKSLDE